jgi:hypothetical protein
MAKQKREKKGKPVLLNSAKVAALLDVSEDKVLQWIREGILPTARNYRNEHGGQSYLIDQSVVLDDVFQDAIAAEVASYRGRSGAGRKATGARARNERSRHTDALRHIEAIAPGAAVARLLRAGYYLSLLDQLAKSRWQHAEQARLDTLRDKLLAAIYQHYQTDEYWLLGSGGLEVTLKNTALPHNAPAPSIILERVIMREEFRTPNEYLGYAIQYQNLRYDFLISWARAVSWLDPMTVTRLPQREEEEDDARVGPYRRREAQPEPHNLSEGEIVDALAPIYQELTGLDRAAFMTYLPEPPQPRYRPEDDEDGTADYLRRFQR